MFYAHKREIPVDATHYFKKTCLPHTVSKRNRSPERLSYVSYRGEVALQYKYSNFLHLHTFLFVEYLFAGSETRPRQFTVAPGRIISTD